MDHLKCCICFELFDIKQIVAGPCGHTFHNHCILKWVDNNHACPVCRKKCTRRDIIALYFDVSTANDTLPLGPCLQNELDSKDADLKAKIAELALASKKVKDLQKHAAATEQNYHTMRQNYLASQSELDSIKLRLKEITTLQKVKNREIEAKQMEIATLEDQLNRAVNERAMLQGTQQETEEILREQGVKVAKEVGISAAKNMANLCSILKRELCKLRAQKVEHKKREAELLYQIGLKDAKLNRIMQNKRKFSEIYTPKAIMIESHRDLGLIAAEEEHAKETTPTAAGINTVSASSSFTKDGGNVDVTPIPYHFSEKKRPTVKKKMLIDKPTSGECLSGNDSFARRPEKSAAIPGYASTTAEDKHEVQLTPTATESKHAKQMTLFGGANNIVPVSSSTKDGGNVDVTPIPYNFPEEKRPTMKKVVLDKAVTQSMSSMPTVSYFSKPSLPSFVRNINTDNNDSITRTGYNGLGGHERVIFSRARELTNTKPYKKNPNVKKAK